MLQVAGLMIAAELAQRRLVQLKQNLAQLLGFEIAGCETLPIHLSQRADEGVAVLVADFAMKPTRIDRPGRARLRLRWRWRTVPTVQCKRR